MIRDPGIGLAWVDQAHLFSPCALKFPFGPTQNVTLLILFRRPGVDSIYLLLIAISVTWSYFYFFQFYADEPHSINVGPNARYHVYHQIDHRLSYCLGRLQTRWGGSYSLSWLKVTMPIVKHYNWIVSLNVSQNVAGCQSLSLVLGLQWTNHTISYRSPQIQGMGNDLVSDIRWSCPGYKDMTL